MTMSNETRIACVLKHITFSLIMFLAGCRTTGDSRPITFTAGMGTDNRLALKIEILDDSESWFGTAELYLKVISSSTPSFFCLYPLNVKSAASGSRTMIVETPYIFEGERHGTITFELLDDDYFNKKEEELLVKASQEGMGLVCDGVNIYATSKKLPILVGDKTRRTLNELLGDALTVLIKNVNQHSFESLGTREIIVYSAGSILISNPVTIVDKKNKARCDIKTYLIPQ